MKDKDIDFLKNISIFNDLREDEIKKIISILKIIKYKTGEIIINEGEIGDTMFVFKEGKVQISHQITLKLGSSWGEAEKSMAILDGSTIGFFGEMSLLTGAPRSATIKAITDCTLYKIEKNDFERFAKRNPIIAYSIMEKIAKVLSNRIVGMNDNILKLTTALSIALSKRKK
ncbi:hypothetical protein OSSY52_17370 [Tepiditoga spiralis]|uniref:Cyclic nucleotide-binding domain-containing protein n=1 Tax=Tepiditoga spiralis TaxID=2108365 RepID=A0A7G1G870_9BACT|nr:cyclic nucleotide-binding domain-containing protein [Tepiditoga spiralis]BBE31596.1 hypothetical protein OSSY52_17370 [Tepiditoga spiralis]